MYKATVYFNDSLVREIEYDICEFNRETSIYIFTGKINGSDLTDIIAAVPFNYMILFV